MKVPVVTCRICTDVQVPSVLCYTCTSVQYLGYSLVHVQVQVPEVQNCQTPDLTKKKKLLENLEGSISAWLFTCFVVTLVTVLILLWPLKMLKLSKL